MGSARAQGYVEVVRGATTFVSNIGITDAIGQAGGLQSGDVVLIQGLVNTSGFPKAYSTSTTLESFPISIPAGVTVKARDSVPVHIVAAAGSGTTTLFSLVPVSGVAPTTRLEKLNLAGAVQAIVLQTGAGENLVVVLDKVRFGRNNTGLYAVAQGGEIKVQVKDCKIMDGVPVQDPLPINRLFSKGLDFRAEDDAGRIEAVVNNFSTFGIFPASQMKPVPYSTLNLHDMEAYADAITRLIEVYAQGMDMSSIGEHDDGNLNTILPVPQVILTVNGSTLHGAAIQAEAGWDVALYADTDSSGHAVHDYLAYWDLSFNGTTIQAFKAAGIYGEATTETRGFLRLNDVTVKDIALTAEVDLTLSYRSGVHLVAEEAYIAFEADNSSFNDNRGNGVYLMTASSIQADTDFPTGLYLDLDRCAMHGNSLSGLFLDGAPNKPHWAHSTQGAIVGGTYDSYPTPGQRSLIWEGNEPDPRLPRGQGVVNACQISNNGSYGIRVNSIGRLSNAQDCASTRFVNTFVWNNPSGGFYARLEPDSGSPLLAPALFTPLVHCTFAYNHTGGASGWSAEILPVNIGAGSPVPLFFWDDDPAVADGRVLGTSINNCVFQRLSSTDPDFGPSLDGLDLFDDGMSAIWILDPSRVPWAGIRGQTTDIVSSMLDFPVSTFSASPFVGPILPASRQANQFFLDNQNMTEPKFFFSHDYLRAGYSLSEDSYDIEWTIRVTLVDRDKGGEED